jgi:hypothetical protein
MAVKKRPALQGELDGACGFYAMANGIHLLEPELALPEIFPSFCSNMFLMAIRWDS